MNFEMRTLQATDLFVMVKILNGIKIKELTKVFNSDEVKAIKKEITEDNEDQKTTEIGTTIMLGVVGLIVENLSTIENDLYKFLGSLIGKKPQEVSKMDLGDFMDLLFAVVQKDEFKDFFNRASKLVK